jgi:hypothetical protein
MTRVWLIGLLVGGVASSVRPLVVPTMFAGRKTGAPESVIHLVFGRARPQPFTAFGRLPICPNVRRAVCGLAALSTLAREL